MARDLPIVDGWLHYRHMDVSTTHTLTRLWVPELEWQGRPAAQHRVCPELYESIRILRQYRQALWSPDA